MTNSHTTGTSVMLKGKRRNGVIYRERLEWYKLQVVNEVNNLHCALDIRTGTIMTVTQVSYYA